MRLAGTKWCRDSEKITAPALGRAGACNVIPILQRCRIRGVALVSS